MGSFANSLFRILLGWFQGIVSAVWSAFTSENGSSFLEWIGRYWILLAGILCVVGLAADLSVYIFRWKPFRVWKSFFHRNRDTDGEKDEEEPEPRPVERGREHAFRTDSSDAAENAARIRADSRPEPDFSQWEPEPEERAAEPLQPDGEPSIVTGAGYVVPADSPYRRPSSKAPAGSMTEKAVQRQEYPEKAERDEPGPVTPKRRRRIRVAELFTDPEEDLRQFDAPQHVIDSRKAYRDPVYPRGWKKSEEDGE